MARNLNEFSPEELQAYLNNNQVSSLGDPISWSEKNTLDDLGSLSPKSYAEELQRSKAVSKNNPYATETPGLMKMDQFDKAKGPSSNVIQIKPEGNIPPQNPLTSEDAQKFQQKWKAMQATPDSVPENIRGVSVDKFQTPTFDESGLARTVVSEGGERVLENKTLVPIREGSLVPVAESGAESIGSGFVKNLAGKALNVGGIAAGVMFPATETGGNVDPWSAAKIDIDGGKKAYAYGDQSSQYHPIAMQVENAHKQYVKSGLAPDIAMDKASEDVTHLKQKQKTYEDLVKANEDINSNVVKKMLSFGAYPQDQLDKAKSEFEDAQNKHKTLQEIIRNHISETIPGEEYGPGNTLPPTSEISEKKTEEVKPEISAEVSSESSPAAKETPAESPKASQLMAEQLGRQSINTRAALQAQQDLFDKRTLINQLGGAAATIGGGIGAAFGGGWVKPQTPNLKPYEQGIEIAGQQLKNYQELQKKEMEDPNSQVSANMRNILKQMNPKFNVPNTLSAADVEKIQKQLVSERIADIKGEFVKVQREDAAKKQMDMNEAKNERQAAQQLQALKLKSTSELTNRGTRMDQALFGSQKLLTMANIPSNIKADALEKIPAANWDNLTGPQVAETAINLNTILTQSTTAPQKTLDKLIPVTVTGGWQKFVEKMSNSPQPMKQGEFVKNMLKTAIRERDLAAQVKGDAIKKIFSGTERIKKYHPEDYQNTLDTIEEGLGLPIFSGKIQKESVPAEKSPPHGQTVMQNGHTYNWNSETGKYE